MPYGYMLYDSIAEARSSCVWLYDYTAIMTGACVRALVCDGVRALVCLRVRACVLVCGCVVRARVCVCERARASPGLGVWGSQGRGRSWAACGEGKAKVKQGRLTLSLYVQYLGRPASIAPRPAIMTVKDIWLRKGLPVFDYRAI